MDLWRLYYQAHYPAGSNEGITKWCFPWMTPFFKTGTLMLDQKATGFSLTSVHASRITTRQQDQTKSPSCFSTAQKHTWYYGCWFPLRQPGDISVIFFTKVAMDHEKFGRWHFVSEVNMLAVSNKLAPRSGSKQVSDVAWMTAFEHVPWTCLDCQYIAHVCECVCTCSWPSALFLHCLSSRQLTDKINPIKDMTM